MLIRKKIFNFFKSISPRGRVLTGKKKILAFLLILIVSLAFVSEVRQKVIAQTTITLAEFQLHNSSSNCWIMIQFGTQKKVYNVTGHGISGNPLYRFGHMNSYIKNYCGTLGSNGKGATDQYGRYSHGGATTLLNNIPGVYKGILDDSPAPTPTGSPPIVHAPATIAYMGDARPSKFMSDGKGITELTKDFNQVVAQSPTGTVDAVFLIGDFDKIAQTQTAYNNSTLKAINMPLYFVMGNHEVDDDDPNNVRKLFPYSGFGITLNPGPNGTQSTSYSMDIGGIHVVNLNVYWDGGTGPESYHQRDGDVVTDLRNWLSGDLAAKAGMCKVVIAHEPLYPKGRHTGDSLNKYGANRDDLQALFVAQKVGVFVGAHTHFARVNDPVLENTGGVYHTDAGVSGQKTEDGEDPFATILYTSINSSNQMILTWKKGGSSSWSTGGTYTAQCDDGGGPSPTQNPTPPIPTPIPPPCVEDSSCDDNNQCTSGDTCTGGVCRGTPKECADTGTDSECTFDACDPATGACTHTDTCGGLVPCGRLVDNPKTGQINEQAPCDLCSAFYMVKGIINFVVEIAFGIAILILVIAGIFYATSLGDQRMVDLARRAIYYTVVGLFIIFLAWILIAAILQAIGYSNISNWNQVDCTLFSGAIAPPAPPAPPGPPAPPAPPGPPIPPVPPTVSFPVYGPTPGSFSASCTHMVSVGGSTVTAKDSSGTVVSTGTLNQVLGNTAKSGNHVCIQEGTYTLNSISLPEKVFIECLPGASSAKPLIRVLPTVSKLIYLKSDSSIKGCSFEFVSGTGNAIYVYGAVKNWSVENNHFINVDGSIRIVNDNASDPPTSGWGSVFNNTGLHSRLGGIQGGRYITFKDNKFYDYSGDEFFDFNGKNSKFDSTDSPNFENTLENNIFENVSSGYSLNDEAIDMIGYNNNNIVRNNRIVGNFQRGIGPRYEASGNLIEGNYLEYKSGPTGSGGGVALTAHPTDSSRFPANNKVINNTIVGTVTGVSLSGAKNNTVTNNSINATQCGISIKSSSVGNIISGNIFLNPGIPQTCN